jgi:hypothetical protein
MPNAPAQQHVIKRDDLIEMLNRLPNNYVVIECFSEIEEHDDIIGYIESVSVSNGNIVIQSHMDEVAKLVFDLNKANSDIQERDDTIEKLRCDIIKLENQIEGLESSKVKGAQ